MIESGCIVRRGSVKGSAGRRMLFLSGLLLSACVARGNDGPPSEPETAGLDLQPGFRATVFADGVGRARHLAVRENGDVYVAEDPDNLQIVALTQSGGVKPIVQVTGQFGTEITGPALTPDGSRLCFSSQRDPGTTYEVTGPFMPAAQVPMLGGLAHGLLAGAVASAAALRLWSGRMGRVQDDEAGD